MCQRGWSPVIQAQYPADEIAAAVIGSGALACGLSITYPADDPRLPGELRLRRQLPESFPLLSEAQPFILTRLCSRNWRFPISRCDLRSQEGSAAKRRLLSIKTS